MNFDDWLVEASLSRLELENKGCSVKQVKISPKNFKIWCQKKKKRSDATSRSEYVSELLYKAHS